jgi:dephospho-CoA kinase
VSHTSLVERIGELFPGCVRSGTLDRECLAEIVLGDRAKLAALEAVVHPAVREWRQAFIDRQRDAPALLFEIPLLFETGGEYDFDKVVVVSAPGQVQRARVLERRGMTLAKLESVLARQMPDEEKRRRADFVIDTDTDLSTTEAQVRDILACLGVAAG